MGAFVSLMRSGAPVPAWLAAVLLLGGIGLLLVRGNLGRKLVMVVSAIALLAMFWRGLGLGTVAIVGVVAMIMLAASMLLSPFFKGRW